MENQISPYCFTHFAHFYRFSVFFFVLFVIVVVVVVVVFCLTFWPSFLFLFLSYIFFWRCSLLLNHYIHNGLGEAK